MERAQRVEALESFDWIVRSALSETGHPNRVRIAEAYGCSIYGMSVHEEVRPASSLAEVECPWRWRGSGHLELRGDDADWAVPYLAEVSFAKLGKHLFSKSLITSFERTGEPSVTEFDDVVEGYVSDSDL